MDFKQLVKERDEAFIDFVRSGNEDKLTAYCNRWDVPLNQDKDIRAAGVYKAVQGIKGMPQNVKDLAAEKCKALGFDPYTFA